MKVSDDVFEKMLGWDMIHLSVMDRQMAVQLNKLSTFMPNLLFFVNTDLELYTLFPGTKKRRVWKKR